jgi:hypothetical protein
MDSYLEEQVFFTLVWGDFSEVVYICLYRLYTNNNNDTGDQMCFYCRSIPPSFGKINLLTCPFYVDVYSKVGYKMLDIRKLNTDTEL